MPPQICVLILQKCVCIAKNKLFRVVSARARFKSIENAGKNRKTAKSIEIMSRVLTCWILATHFHIVQPIRTAHIHAVRFSNTFNRHTIHHYYLHISSEVISFSFSNALFMCIFRFCYRALFIIQIKRCDVVRQLACSVMSCINRWERHHKKILYLFVLRKMHEPNDYSAGSITYLHMMRVLSRLVLSPSTNDSGGFSIYFFCCFYCNVMLNLSFQLRNSKRKIIAEVATNMQ